jgi:acyl dehydratase
MTSCAPSRCPVSLELHCGPVGAIDLALYAAASGDHNPLHLDEGVARTAGFEQPLVHGMLTMAYTARLFSQNFGVTALLALNTRFTGAAQRGASLVLRASLLEEDGQTAHYTLSVCTEAGSEVVTGSARVKLALQ